MCHFHKGPSEHQCKYDLILCFLCLLCLLWLFIDSILVIIHVLDQKLAPMFKELKRIVNYLIWNFQKIVLCDFK